MSTPDSLRKTTQHLIPVEHPATEAGSYDIYPIHPVGNGRIGLGFDELARRIADQTIVVVDGYVGVYWEKLRTRLDDALGRLGRRVAWRSIDEALRSGEEIERLVEPFLGGDDPLWGTRFTGSLADFFSPGRLPLLRPDADADISILYGCGASLAGWGGHLVYVDLPKNELQFRSRSGSIDNLGTSSRRLAKEMYKRFYFVDWPALNRHKASLLDRIDMIVDEQRPDLPLFMSGDHLRDGLDRLAGSSFRVRPWFEPGPWGGNWIKEHIPTLPQDVPNYAWSFELIVPENGLIFESDGRMLEVSFDMLMYRSATGVVGSSADRFAREFPIRFDFLDTYAGGNLSVQCHPRPSFIAREFGESFTQDETYYILDCEPGAVVYLGFRGDTNVDEFRRELERSQVDGEPIEVERFVQTVPSRKHDLLLIPNGTIHCSGRDNLVLEISATPYIFTFKMYDWVRRDLDGGMRPLNIERAFANLYFDRRGERIAEEFISRPRVVSEGDGWRRLHLPTHPHHFYDVHRFEFDGTIEVETNDSCQVMSLVEGESILLETPDGTTRRFAYAETFVVSAAAGRFTLKNAGDARAMVVCAFVKSDLSGTSIEGDWDS